MKPRHLYTTVLCLLLGAAYVCSYFIKPAEIAKEPELYTCYASCFPLYAIASKLIDDVPGIKVYQLIQPTDTPISDYSLSDWDKALLNNADILIMGGSGLESFSDYYNDHSIVISLLNRESSHFSPYDYMTVEGLKELSEALCANLVTADEMYVEVYIKNLTSLLNDLCSIEEQINDIFSRLKGFRVYVTNEPINTLCSALGLDCFIIDGESLPNDSSIPIIADQSFLSQYSFELSQADFKIACIDTFTSHSAAEGCQPLFDLTIENAEIIADIIRESTYE